MADSTASKRKPNQNDVARLAGVSQKTVSLVVANSPAIPKATADRVWSAVSQLGYLPNRVAQSLRTHQTKTLAAVIPDISNPFYPAFARGIQDVADDYGYNLVLYNTDGIGTKELECLKSAQQSRVDGIIGAFFGLERSDLHPFLKENVPIVRFEPVRPVATHDSLDVLFLDNVAAAADVVKHLHDKGHTILAIVTADIGPGSARLEGFSGALRQYGMHQGLVIHSADFTEADGYAAVEPILSAWPRPTAVFAANDLMAIGLMQGLQAAGIRIPDDIAIVGFDDIPAARYVTPPLTTVTQFQEQIGRKAAQALFERLSMDGATEGRNIEVPYQLIVREST